MSLPADERPAFDLQSHSTYSDGSLAPAQVVRLAAAAGVELFALTDHDTVDGVDEALAEAEGLPMHVVSGCELSSVDGEHQDVHILGYGIDHHDQRFLERLSCFRQDREGRAWAMADRVRGLGYALDEARLVDMRDAGLPIGRPHLASAVVAHPDNAERLAREGLQEMTPFLVEYLIEGKAAFVGRSTPTVREAIQTIHDAGGLAVWAHPFWDIEDPREVLETIDRFCDWGIDGIEAFYPSHTREHATLLAGECARRDLLSTGSADFHGPGHKLFSTFRTFSTYGHLASLDGLNEAEPNA